MVRSPPDGDLPPPALELAILLGRVPPPWFVPIEAPACGEEVDVPASATNDGVERRLACDRILGHAEGTHRQVTDNEEGVAMEWTTYLIEVREVEWADDEIGNQYHRRSSDDGGER